MIANYRPISLTKVIRMLYERCLLEILDEEVKLSISQGGFRKQRGTLDQIAVLQYALLRAKADKIGLTVMFLDIKAAYDTVDRDTLWGYVRERGVPDHMLASLQALFDQNVSTPDPWSTGNCRHRSGSGGAYCKAPSCPRCYTRSS